MAHRHTSSPMEQVQTLRKIYLARHRRNPRYSLRAFAEAIGLPSGRLSEVLQGKRRLTPVMAEKIASSLALSLKERRCFLGTDKKGKRGRPSLVPLKEDEFSLIADPLHFHLLSLLETNKQVGDAVWAARRLKRKPIEIDDALARLTRLGLTQRTENGYRVENSEITTTHDVPSMALRTSHRASIEQAIKSLDEVPVELRDISSITMAVDSTKLPEAKKIVRRFRRQMASLLESGNKNEVYELNIQLIPISYPLTEYP